MKTSGKNVVSKCFISVPVLPINTNIAFSVNNYCGAVHFGEGRGDQGQLRGDQGQLRGGQAQHRGDQGQLRGSQAQRRGGNHAIRNQRRAGKFCARQE